MKYSVIAVFAGTLLLVPPLPAQPRQKQPYMQQIPRGPLNRIRPPDLQEAAANLRSRNYQQLPPELPAGIIPRAQPPHTTASTSSSSSSASTSSTSAQQNVYVALPREPVDYETLPPRPKVTGNLPPRIIYTNAPRSTGTQPPPLETQALHDAARARAVRDRADPAQQQRRVDQVQQRERAIEQAMVVNAVRNVPPPTRQPTPGPGFGGGGFFNGGRPPEPPSRKHNK